MEFKISRNFSEDLCEKWGSFYQQKGGSYNLSSEWCKTWFKHFGKEKELFIITGWQEDALMLVAPFYRKKNRLFALGSYPDFYDGMEILYDDNEFLMGLVNFIIEQKLEMDFKFVPSDSLFFKYLLRRLEQENIYKLSLYGYTMKPLVYKEKEREKKLEQKFKKRGRIAKREINDEFAYSFDTEKKQEYLEEFINFHKSKWTTFKSEDARKFITDLYYNSNLAILSRLYLKNSDKTLAYEFKYKGSNNVLYKSIFSFNHDYSTLSPGLCLLHYDLSRDINYIDHGRGSYEYKYLHTSKEDAILCLKADLSWKRYRKIYYFLKNIKERISRYEF